MTLSRTKTIINLIKKKTISLPYPYLILPITSGNDPFKPDYYSGRNLKENHMLPSVLMLLFHHESRQEKSQRFTFCSCERTKLNPFPNNKF